MSYHKSCIIREVPLPQRDCCVAPPERWEGVSRPAAPSRRRRRRRTSRLFPALLALALVFSFMLGRASAGGQRAGVPSVVRGSALHQAEAGMPVTVLPADPAAPDELPAGTAPVEGLPAAETDPAPAEEAEAWNLVLVNKDHALTEDYEAPELTKLANGHAVDSRVYPALQEMMDAAKAAGVRPTICSSFRTWATQERLYWNKVARLKNAGWDPETVEDEAARWVARPGTSEHQAGLAVDIVDKSYQSLDHRQENTAAQKWLMAHCWEYGFILRYPSEKSGITGVGYEPWHYRYVGKEAALEMKEQGVCLEEYIAGKAAVPQQPQ